MMELQARARSSFGFLGDASHTNDGHGASILNGKTMRYEGASGLWLGILGWFSPDSLPSQLPTHAASGGADDHDLTAFGRSIMTWSVSQDGVEGTDSQLGAGTLANRRFGFVVPRGDSSEPGLSLDELGPHDLSPRRSDPIPTPRSRISVPDQIAPDVSHDGDRPSTLENGFGHFLTSDISLPGFIEVGAVIRKDAVDLGQFAPPISHDASGNGSMDAIDEATTLLTANLLSNDWTENYAASLPTEMQPRES